MIDHHEIYMKHSGSRLSDMNARIEIDHVGKQVRLMLSHFDSGLVTDMLERLNTHYAVCCFSDDSSGWNAPAPPYRLCVEFGGLSFTGQATRTMKIGQRGGDVVVALRPTPQPKPATAASA